jgi:antitoxin component HigA of HigAB toxin-antitoxin module
MSHVLDPKAITTYREYLSALDELDHLMLCDPDTPAGQRFDELCALIDAYELSHEPTAVPGTRVAA